MSNIVTIHTRRAQTSRGLTTTASIVPGSKRACFIDRVLQAAHAAREEKARFRPGDAVALQGCPSDIGTVRDILITDRVRYLVSFDGDRAICDESALVPAGA